MLVKAILFIVLLSGGTSLAFASDIQFLTHTPADNVYEDEKGELRGKHHSGRRAFYLELVREMMIHLDYPRDVQIIPIKRALRMVQTESNYALFNVNRTPDRENTVKWIGPLHRSITHFYELKATPTGIQTLEDAKQVDGICVLNGNLHHLALEEWGFTNLQLHSTYFGCIQMLLKGRINLTPVSNISSILLNNPEYAETIQKTPVKVSDAKGYLVFSKNIPDPVVEEWQNALDQLKQSGKYDELIRQYMHVE